MTNTHDLYQAKVKAQAELERLETEARAIRATLTEAERKARNARKAFEAARLAWVIATEGERK